MEESLNAGWVDTSGIDDIVTTDSAPVSNDPSLEIMNKTNDDSVLLEQNDNVEFGKKADEVALLDQNEVAIKNENDMPTLKLESIDHELCEIKTEDFLTTDFSPESPPPNFSVNDDTHSPFHPIFLTNSPLVTTASTTPQNSYLCQFCDKYFRKKEGLDKHFKKFHSESNFKCQICGMTFGAEKEFFAHLNMHAFQLDPDMYFNFQNGDGAGKERSNSPRKSPSRRKRKDHLVTLDDDDVEFPDNIEPSNGNDKYLEYFKNNKSPKATLSSFSPLHSFSPKLMSLSPKLLTTSPKLMNSTRLLSPRVFASPKFHSPKTASKLLIDSTTFERSMPSYDYVDDDMRLLSELNPSLLLSMSPDNLGSPVRFNDAKPTKKTLDPKRPFNCPRCDLSFSREKALNAHFLCHHVDDDEFDCDKCDEAFVNEEALLEHVIDRHPIEVDCNVTTGRKNGRFKESKNAKADKKLNGHNKIESYLKHLAESSSGSLSVNDDAKNFFRVNITKKPSNPHGDASPAESSKARRRQRKQAFPKYNNVCNDIFDESGMIDMSGMTDLIETNGSADLMIVDDVESRSFSSRDSHVCTQCGLELADVAKLRDHLNNVHLQTDGFLSDVNSGDGNADGLTCNICGQSFAKALELLAHAGVHADEDSSGVFKCVVCGDVFAAQECLELHVDRTHGGNHTLPIMCDKCGRSFNDKKGLVRHASHGCTNSRICCPTCDKVFFGRHRLKRHMQTHTGHHKQCDVCLECFADARSFNQHKAVHVAQNGRAFPCNQCGKVFGSRSSQQIHYRTHTGERPYGCQFCFKAFADGGTLRKHERIHTGEKPYACAVCPRAFNQRVVLREHIRCHHSGINAQYERTPMPYACEVCSERFGDHTKLIEHLIKHSDANTASNRKPSVGPRKYKRRRKLRCDNGCADTLNHVGCKFEKLSNGGNELHVTLSNGVADSTTQSSEMNNNVRKRTRKRKQTNRKDADDQVFQMESPVRSLMPQMKSVKRENVGADVDITGNDDTANNFNVLVNFGVKPKIAQPDQKCLVDENITDVNASTKTRRRKMDMSSLSDAALIDRLLKKDEQIAGNDVNKIEIEDSKDFNLLSLEEQQRQEAAAGMVAFYQQSTVVSTVNCDDGSVKTTVMTTEVSEFTEPPPTTC